MGFLSHLVRRSDLVEGDHIYVYRKGHAHSHHAIYMGKGQVIHFNNNKKVSKGPKSCSDPECGFHRRGSGVFKSCLDCFLDNGKPRRYQYGLNKIEFGLKVRVGTCTCAESDVPETVIHRASYLLHHGFAKYNLIKNNCEDFALYCKTGLLDRSGAGCSGQVGGSGYYIFQLAGLATMSAFAVPMTIALASGPPGWVAIPICTIAAHAAFGLLPRSCKDIKFLPGVVKVEVEHVPQLRARNTA